jgi:ATP-dependent RNA/DNA helicase IGHMBP2
MEEIKKLLELIEIERKEDLRQYQNQVILTPLHERRKKGLTWYPIKVNHIEIGAGENFYISLERTSQINDNHAFQVGGSVSVFHNATEKSKNPKIQGVISALWRNSMRVAVQVDELPDWVEYGNLGIDVLFDTVTYQEMDTALKKVMEASNDRLAELRNVLLNKQKASFEENVPDYFYVHDLNESQNKAVRNILAAKDVAIIHGPPGTGKTTTMVEAVKLTLQNEKQVLVTAPSNTAVDLLTEKLAQKGLKVLRIGNPARMSEDLIHHSLDTQIAQHNDYKFLKQLRKDAEEYKKMANKYKRKFGVAERDQRRLLFAEATKMLNEASVLEKYMVESLVNQAQVITATLVGSVNKYIRFRRFSTVFIDEAGQALEPATWIPITKADKVVLAGDHCQLPPTVKSFEAAQAGLSVTLFEKIIQQQKVGVMLQTQYRMNEKIMGFSNQMFYNHELKADERVRHHLLVTDVQDAVLGSPVEFIDTAGCGFEEKVNEETQSKCNPEEAQLLIKHLKNLLEYSRITYPQILNEYFSVGIISPYNAQVTYLQEQITQNTDLADFLPFLDIKSIDGFQGQEREVMYISLVRSNDKAQIGFLSDTRRMNVALTRARKKLVVFGDSATLGNHPFYQSFLAYIEQIGAYRSAWEWMGE